MVDFTAKISPKPKTILRLIKNSIYIPNPNPQPQLTLSLKKQKNKKNTHKTHIAFTILKQASLFQNFNPTTTTNQLCNLRKGYSRIQRTSSIGMYGKHGKSQTIETLINEESLLLAKFIRNERETWIPRITIP